MNCKPGDLAYVAVPSGFSRLLDRKFVTVQQHGIDDLTPACTREKAARYHSPLWFCVFQTPFAYEGRTCHGAYLLDAWLRPIRENPGNESFVTEARKSLPRSKDTVTITERGEPA